MKRKSEELGLNKINFLLKERSCEDEKVSCRLGGRFESP
jgi:hypothetical protein